MPCPQSVIDEMAAKYNDGWSLRQIQRHFGFSYGTVHKHMSSHPDVTMRDKRPDPSPAHPWRL
jgi:hypothetical protein